MKLAKTNVSCLLNKIVSLISCYFDVILKIILWKLFAAVTCFLGTGNNLIKQTLVVFPAFPELINQMACMYNACIRKNHTRRALLHVYLTHKKCSRNHLQVCTNLYIGIFNSLKKMMVLLHINFSCRKLCRKGKTLGFLFFG